MTATNDRGTRMNTNPFTAAAAESDRGYRTGGDIAATLNVVELVARIAELSDRVAYPGHYWSGVRFGLGDALVARPAYYATK